MAGVKKNIVIIGAGFAGIKTLKHLGTNLAGQANITLIDVNNYFLFTPLLHEVATGELFPENIVIPLRPVVAKYGANFSQARVKSVDLKKKVVTTTEGKINYDVLVAAPGSTTNFYDTPGAATNCFTLKDLNDAIKFKNNLIRSFNRAQSLPPIEQVKTLTFVVVGGGPTGVGLAAEISDFIKDSFKPFYPEQLLSLVKIILIQKDNHILPQFSETLRTRCFSELAKKGIKIMLNNGVKEVSAEGITLDNGEIIPSSCVVWTAGVKPSEISFSPEPERVRGRVAVDQFLRLPDHPEVYVLGDLAYFKNQNGEPLPMLAQVADRAAKVVARNINSALSGRLPVPFTYHHWGTLISLGNWWAAGEIGPFHIYGRFTWWLWRTVYLFKMPTWSKKVQIMLDWTIDLFSARDVSILPCENKRKL